MVIVAAAATLYLLATWAIHCLAAIGIGLAIRYVLARTSGLTGARVAMAFWAGFAALVLFTQLWHLAAPVSPAAAAIAGVVALLGLALHWRDLRAWVRTCERRPAAIATTGVLLVAAWAAYRSTGPVANFDTYMYHIPVVEWYREQPLVPGLGNLHGRFAFNNANFLLAALIESGPGSADSTRVLHGVVLLGFLIHLAARLTSWAADAMPREVAAFDLVLAAPALALVNDPVMFTGLSPEFSAALAVFVAFSMLFAAMRGIPGELPERGVALVVATALLASAAAIKLSFAAAAVPAWLVGMLALWRLRRGGGVLPRRAFVVAGVLAVTIGGAWVARGVVASGYPLYPNDFLPLPVDWRVPLEQARAEYDWIRLFGRYFHVPDAYNAGAWSAHLCSPAAWVRPWMSTVVQLAHAWQIAVPLALAAGFGALSLVRRAGRRRFDAAAWLLPPVLAGIAVWWRIAPRPDFGFWLFWLLAALAAAHAASAMPARRSIVAAAALLLAVVGTLPLLGAGLRAARRSDGSNLAAAASVLRTDPPENGWRQPTRWLFPLTTYTTASGLELRVPEGHRCARAALPCTSHPARNLQLRHPGSLRGGFRVTGAWQAERWPNPWASFLSHWRSPTACAALP
jgi:hypothetical protein